MIRMYRRAETRLGEDTLPDGDPGLLRPEAGRQRSGMMMEVRGGERRRPQKCLCCGLRVTEGNIRARSAIALVGLIVMLRLILEWGCQEAGFMDKSITGSHGSGKRNCETTWTTNAAFRTIKQKIVYMKNISITSVYTQPWRLRSHHSSVKRAVKIRRKGQLSQTLCSVELLVSVYDDRSRPLM
jgi:hypothetical protein